MWWEFDKSDRDWEKWPVLGLILTPSNISVSQVQLLDGLGSLGRVWGEEDPSLVGEDNQHNSVQRLIRDMGCVSTWVHVIQLTNWSSSISQCPAHPPSRSWINKHCRGTWILLVVILAVADWELCWNFKSDGERIAEVAWGWARRPPSQAMEGVHRRQSRAARRPSSWGRSSPSSSSSSASASAPPSRPPSTPSRRGGKEPRRHSLGQFLESSTSHFSYLVSRKFHNFYLCPLCATPSSLADVYTADILSDFRTSCGKVPFNMGGEGDISSWLHHWRWHLHPLWPPPVGQPHHSLPRLLLLDPLPRGAFSSKICWGWFDNVEWFWLFLFSLFYHGVLSFLISWFHCTSTNAVENIISS